MSTISGTCGAPLASQLFWKGIEQQARQHRLEQRELQRQVLQQANASPPGDRAEQRRDQARAINAAEPFKGGLLDTYA